MCEMCGRNSHHGFAPTRRGLLLGASAVGVLWAGPAGAKERKAPPKPQNVLSPDASLKRLMAGNERYVDGDSQRHDFRHEREALVGGQNRQRRLRFRGLDRVRSGAGRDAERFRARHLWWHRLYFHA